MDKIKYNIFSIIWIFVYALILFFFTFLIGKDSVQSCFTTLSIIFSTNSFIFIYVYIISSYLIILGLLFISKAIFKNNFISNLVVTILVCLISIISYYKYTLLRSPLVPTDILLIGNANQIAEFGLTFPPLHIIYSVVILGAILVLQYVLEKRYNIDYKIESWKKELYRIPLFFIGIVILFFTCVEPPAKNLIKKEIDDFYDYSGGVTAFFMYLSDFWTTVPEGYSKEEIEQIKVEYMNANDVENVDEKVNVILIMNESFSDPTKLNDVEFSIDPLYDIRNLFNTDKNCKIGECITPSLGGGTSVPEFEVLTGLSSYYFEKHIYPFTRYITSDINSIVREYNKNGYETLGVHTNTETFYNRKGVYRYLGFKDTVFLEDIEQPKYKCDCVADEEIKNQIIKEFEDNKGVNKFVFGVTMQNHMPYENKGYESFDITVTSDKFSENEIKELTNYVQGVYDGNKMYVELVEFLKGYDEPTILVMFGDHLPAVANYVFYDKSDYSLLDKYKTPYIIWSNYGEDLSNVDESMMSSELGLRVYELSGNSLPWYLRLYKDIYQEYEVFNNQFVVDNDGDFLDREVVDNSYLVQKGEWLQYKILNKRDELY